VYATTTESADCEVNPVTHWLIGPRPELLGGGAHFACLIGRIPASGCPAGRFCIDRDLVCPRGARCTVTTRAVWYDDDANARQGAQAFASVGLPKSDDYGHRPGDWRWNEWEDRSCSTGLDGARCSVSARYSVLGDDFRGGFGELQSPKTRPLYGACSWMPGGDGALANARFGPEEARRLTCAVTVEIQPATPLLALAKGLETVISVPSAGNLVATWLLAGGPTATAAAATRSRPHIASARLAVAEGGVVRLVPRLNAAARRRLRRNKRLPVVLRVEFTPKEGAPIVRTQRLTLKRVARPHRGRRSR
jgi:hypothetical protein